MIFTVIPGGYKRKVDIEYIKIMLLKYLFRQTGNSAISSFLNLRLPNVHKNGFWLLSSGGA